MRGAMGRQVMLIRASAVFVALVAVWLGGCDPVGLVGDARAGFTARFPEKWKPVSPGDAARIPAFVSRAYRFVCEFDQCGRKALGVAAYGNLPERMRTRDGRLPARDDVVALLDQMLELKGGLRDRHVNALDVAGFDGYRVRFSLPSKAGPALIRGNILFHQDRFLFFSVATRPVDEADSERLLEELAASLRKPVPGS